MDSLARTLFMEESKTNLTTVELTDEDAKLFLEFRKHQKQFQQLLDNGVFDSLNGEKVLHKNGLEIRIIETRTVKRF